MNNFYLIGMPGCGKTTIGNFVSKKMKMIILDTDLTIEKSENIKISEMFEKFGEKYFRDLETKYLDKVSKNESVIISTGGGIILKDENIKIMQNTGKIIFIDTSCENILENSKLENRPLLAENKNKIYNLYENRYEKYLNCADIVITNNEKMNKSVDEIVCFIKKCKEL